MKRRKTLIAGLLLAVLVLSPALSAQAWSDIKYVNNVFMPINARYTSVEGNHIGGKARMDRSGAYLYQPTITVQLLQGSGVVRAAGGGPNSDVIIMNGSTLNNSRVSCYWNDNSGLGSQYLSCWRRA